MGTTRSRSEQLTQKKLKLWRAQIFRNLKDNYNLLKSEEENRKGDLYCVQTEIVKSCLKHHLFLQLMQGLVVHKQKEILKILQDINTRIDAASKT